MKRITIFFLIVPVLSIIVKDPSPPEEFKYSYNIQEQTTGDTKSQHEVRKGDSVIGSYSLLDPDGTRRTVKYSADSINGFKASVLSVPVHNFGYQNRWKNVAIPDQFKPKLVNNRAYIPPPYMSAIPSSSYKMIKYFVPAKELASEERTVFGYGEYFRPAKNYYY